MGKTLQFRCTLRGEEPFIWRQFKVSDDYRLDRFHQVIQIVMGWYNSHLHEFILEDRRIGMLMDEVEDETKIYLKDLNLKEGYGMLYVYDFGDGWEHIIELEAISDEVLMQPICINGQMACPPEDCGGIFGYLDLLKTIRDPSHPDYEGMLEWLGEGFDPTEFPKDTINAELRKFAAYHKAHPEDVSTPWHQIAGPPQDMGDMNNFIESMLDKLQENAKIENTLPNPAIDNLSPMDMDNILYGTFEESSPIGFKSAISNEVLAQVPFLNLVLEYLTRLEKVGELKLTPKGNLPRKWVVELYDLGLIKESAIERGIVNINREADSLTVQNIKLICDLAGLTKKRNNKLSLTGNGKKLYKNKSRLELFKKIFFTNIKDFNWGYHDGYMDNVGIQQTFGYTLYLLLRYGKEEKPLTFYVDKNIQAFPMIPTKFEGAWRSPEEMYASCYGVRIFERFLSLYGLVDCKDFSILSDEDASLKVTTIFHDIFEIRKELLSFSKSKFES